MVASRTDDVAALRAEALSKAYGARRALQDVSFSAAPGELLAVIGPERRRQDDAAADPRRRARADVRQRLARPPRGRLGAAAAGDLLEALGAREPAAVRAAGEGRRRRRAVARMLEQTGLRDRARRRGRHAVRRQPAARQHRGRAARRPGGAAARRAVVVARPAPARAAVGVRRPRSRATRHDRRLLDPQRRRGRALRRPAARARRRRAAVHRHARGARARDRRARGASTSRARSCASCAAGATDACAGCCSRTCRSCAARRCWSALLVLYPLVVALLVGRRAVVAARRSRRSRSPTWCRPARRTIDLGGQRLDATTYASSCSTRSTRSASTRARRRSRRCESGEALGALVIPPDVIERLQGTLALGGGKPPTVEVYYSAENPLKRRYVQATIDATLADANKALSDEIFKEAARYLNLIVAGGAVSLPIVGRRRHPRPAQRADDHRRGHRRGCPTTRRRAPRSSRCRASPGSPPTTSTSPSRSSPRSATPVRGRRRGDRRARARRSTSSASRSRW